MRTPHWLGIVLLALVLGTAVGYVIAPSDQTERQSATVHPDDQQSLDDGAGKALPVSAESKVAKPDVEPPAHRAEPESVFAPHAGDSSLIRAIRAIPIPEVPLGKGAISGRVLSIHGEPVAGITVQGYLPDYGKVRYPKFFDYQGRELYAGLEEDIRNMFRQRALARPPELRAISDKDGNWTINGIADGEYLISPRDPGFEFRMPGHRFHAGESVTIYARPLTEMRIKVLDSDGEPTTDHPPRIVDVLRNRQIANTQTAEGGYWMDPAGDVFRPLVPAGVYMVSVLVAGEAAGEPEVVEVKDGQPVDVTLRLATNENAGVGGSINIQGGSYTSGGRDICYARVPAGLTPGEVAAKLSQENLGRLSYVRDRYFFPLKDSGKYVVGLVCGQRVLSWQTIEFDGTEQTVDFEVSPPAPEDSIVVEVSDEQWDSDTARFTLHFQEPSRHRLTLDAWKISEAEYRVIPPTSGEIGDLQPAWISVETRSGTVDLPVMHVKPQHLRAVFDQQTCLMVDVEGWKPPSVSHGNFRVSVRREDDSEVESRSWYSGGRTPAVLGGIQPGAYRLVIEFDSIRLLDEPIDVSGVCVLKRVTLPKFYAVTVVGLKDKGWLRVSGGPYSLNKSVSSRADSVTVYLPAGEYEFSWRQQSEREDRKLSVTVSEDGTVYLPD
ncbi:MAG: hypothetical protein KDB82_01010 [Planctomycetes bacterium]|nr:hypothetical protein [Planctomycetota bacterium]